MAKKEYGSWKKYARSSTSSSELGQVHSSSTTTKSAPLAGLLAHSAEAAGSQLISARQTVRVSGRWTESGSVVGCEVQPWGHGLLGLWTRPWAKSRRLGAWVGLVTDPKPNQKGAMGCKWPKGHNPWPMVPIR
ncbi:hypothetical protein F2Q70_00028093 [Brassica cretica]|uniref:Uncharacterized protein n=1 Tax=Brassica cretica TaxID=69181 RepID=A0A8S9LCW5_BRACR|nr:hypothetical protein F2Q70_00028093 [Brassica cretica]